MAQQFSQITPNQIYGWVECDGLTESDFSFLSPAMMVYEHFAQKNPKPGDRWMEAGCLAEGGFGLIEAVEMIGQ